MEQQRYAAQQHAGNMVHSPPQPLYQSSSPTGFASHGSIHNGSSLPHPHRDPADLPTWSSSPSHAQPCQQLDLSHVRSEHTVHENVDEERKDAQQDGDMARAVCVAVQSLQEALGGLTARVDHLIVELSQISSQARRDLNQPRVTM